MEIVIKLANEVDVEEFCKVINFVSEDITNYRYIPESSKLIIECLPSTDKDLIVKSITNLAKKYKMGDFISEEVFKSKRIDNIYKDIRELPELCYRTGDSSVILKGVALFLFDFFDKEFNKMAIRLGAVQRRYPVLLPVEAYKKTGYLRNSPQYATFCCDARENIAMLENLEKSTDSEGLFEKLQQPHYALSPSACFHTYIECENKKLDEMSVITFMQNVFRNEGRLNYKQIGRLRDYHVREIVFLGDNAFVMKKRNYALQYSIKLLQEWGMAGAVLSASDPFVMPKIQKYKRIQLLEKSKYELRLNVSTDEQISAASFNLHGTAFSYPFKISISGVDEVVTGCVGFGLERWVIAFLSQFGAEPDNWPQVMKEKWGNENEQIYK